jgi:hypothetical protein
MFWKQSLAEISGEELSILNDAASAHLCFSSNKERLVKLATSAAFFLSDHKLTAKFGSHQSISLSLSLSLCQHVNLPHIIQRISMIFDLNRPIHQTNMCCSFLAIKNYTSRLISPQIWSARVYPTLLSPLARRNRR